MRKLLLLVVYILITSCSTNYYFVNLEEDTPIYQNTRNDSELITSIPKGYSAFIAFGTKKHRKVKWKNYTGWVINPVYSLPVGPSSYSSKTNSSSTNYNNSSTKNSSGGAVQVKGYTRKDGTYVRPHTRSAPKRK